jgi:hypothetical protein
MCFGNDTQKTVNTTQSGKTDQTSSNTGSVSYTPNSSVANAATGNVNAATGLQAAGYTPYTGDRVADFSPLQSAGFGVGGNVGTTGTDWTNAYANAPAQNIGYNTIASVMAPYMSQYVGDALAPQLASQKSAFDQQNKAWDAGATGAGAYGDTGWGLGRARLSNDQDLQRQGLIAQGYNTAFNTAIGAGAQDVNNKQNVDTANANFKETALNRLIGGLNSQEGIAQFLQQLGAIQQQQQQAKLNVPYSDYLAKMQYPFLTSQLVNQAVGTAAGAMPAGASSTGTGTVSGTSSGTGQQVTTAPDNSGFQLLGSILGGLAGNPAI